MFSYLSKESNLFMKFKFVFLLLTFQLTQVKSQNIDIAMLDRLNPSSTSADRTFRFISDKAIITTTAAPFAMFLTGMAIHDENLKNNALKTGIALAATTVETYAIKNSIERARPFVVYPNRVVHKGNASGYSFPSGHTSSTFALATSLSLSYPKWYVIVPSYAFAATTAYSRLYLGVHYPSDVLGGMIVGAGTSYLTFKLQRLLDKRYRRKKEFSGSE